MNTDRIQRLQSLLGRIKHNATLPKQPLGQGFVLGGTLPAGSDVSAGHAVPARSTKVTQPMPLVKPLQTEPTPKPATSVQPQAPAKPAPVQPEPAAAKSAPSHPEPSSPQASAPMQPAPAAAQAAPQPMRSIKMTQPMQVMTPLQPAATPKPAQAAEPAPAKPEQPAQPTPSAQPAKPSFWQSAQAAARADSPGAQSGQPAAPASTGTSSSNMQAVHSPLVAVPSVSASMVDGRKARARVPTVIGVAPDFGISKKESPEPPKVEVETEEESIEELDAAEVLDAQSSLPPPPTAAEARQGAAAEDKSQPHVELRQSNSDIDNLSWSEPPAVEVEIEEPPPDSSPRARVAGSIDEALAGVTVDSEPEIPVKTPPPESGRQPAEGIYASSMQAAPVPTPEQLGETVELEEATMGELELDLNPVNPQPAKEELEVEIPKQASVLEPIARTDSQRAPAPSHVEVIGEEPSAATQASRADATLLSDSASLQLEPNVTRRPSPEKAAAVELLQSARAFAPRSFLELLDASLKLGSK